MIAIVILFFIGLLATPRSLTQFGRNAAAELLAKEKLKYVTLYEGEEKALTSNTAIAAKLLNMTGAEAAGWTNGKIVWFTEVTTGVTTLFAKRPYEIVGGVANGFELQEVGGTTVVTIEGHILETATTKVERLKEEVAVARVATAFAAGAADASADTEKVIKVEAGKSIQFAAWSENSALGGGKILAVERLTEKETYGAEGEYKLTSDKLEAPVSLA